MANSIENGRDLKAKIDRCNELMQKLQKEKEELEAQLKVVKKEATKADTSYDPTIDEAIRVLDDATQKGKNIYFEFEGESIYSCETSVNDLCEKFTDFPEKDVKEDIKYRQDRYKQHIPNWLETAKKYVYPQKYEAFVDDINRGAERGWGREEYRGVETFDYNSDVIYAVLDIMENLENCETIDEAKLHFLTDSVIGKSQKGWIEELVLRHAKRGPEYYRIVNPKANAEGFIKSEVDRIEAENKEYASHPMTFEEYEAQKNGQPAPQ